MKCARYSNIYMFLLMMLACVLINQNLFAQVGFNEYSSSKKMNLAYLSTDTLVATTSVFEIIVSGADTILGNGIDEETHWRFTFDLPHNDPTLQIISALLTINLTPMDPAANNDGVWLRGCNCGQIDVGEHTLFQMYTFETELLNTFPAQFILDSLLTGGGISLGYQDDATVSFAQMRLIVQSSAPTITRPQTGELFIAGERDTVKWTGGQAGQFLRIDYSTDNGSTYNLIDIATPADSGYYVWNIPRGLLTTKAKIKISDIVTPTIIAVSHIFKIKGYILTNYLSNGDYDPYNQFQDPYAFANDSTSLWPYDWWHQFDYSSTDPYTSYNYLLGGAFTSYLFLNTNSSDFPDWISWVRTYGVDACYLHTSFPPVYSPTSVIKWSQYYDPLPYGGSCFGMSTSNALYFRYKSEFLTKYPAFPNDDPINIFPDATVIPVINELFTHQNGKSHKDYRNNVGKLKTPNQTLNDIKKMLTDDNEPIRTLGIESNDVTDPGGHSILVYKVEQDVTFLNLYYVFTYDNAYPANIDSAIIIVDTLANNGNGSWLPKYARQNWGGTKWFYLMDPAVDYLTIPVIPKQVPASSPFVLSNEELQIYNTRNSSILITDQQYRNIGYNNGVLINDIPNAFPNIILNGSSGPPIGYDLPNGNYSIRTKDISDDKLSISFFTGNKSFLYLREFPQSTEKDNFFYDGGVSVTNPDQQSKNISLTNIVNETMQEKVFHLSELVLVQNDSVKIINPDDNTLDLISYGSAKEYQIELNLASQLGLGKFQNNNIQLTQNTTHKLVPNWGNISALQLTIYVDEGNDGTIDDTLYIENTVDVEDQGTLLSPNSYNLAQNYPNPFNPTTTIQYSIPQHSNVTLKVYDILGNEVATLVNEEKGRGVYSVSFDASQLSSGIYLYRLQAGSFIETKKMILLR